MSKLDAMDEATIRREQLAAAIRTLERFAARIEPQEIDIDKRLAQDERLRPLFDDLQATRRLLKALGTPARQGMIYIVYPAWFDGSGSWDDGSRMLDRDPYGYFSTREAADAYVASLGLEGERAIVEEEPVDLPRRQLPGAWRVHVDDSGAVVGEQYSTSNTPDSGVAFTDRGQLPLPRFIGHGLTRDEAIEAALAERARRKLLAQ